MLEDLILEYPGKGWNFTYLSSNPNISLHFILTHQHRFKWDWEKITERFSKNDFQLVFENLDLPWDFSYVSQFIQDLSKIDMFPDIPWDYHSLCYNDNVTTTFIDDHCDQPWDWYCLSRFMHCPIEFIDKYKHKDLDFDKLSQVVSPFLIEKYPNIPWTLRGISLNPKISYDYVKENIDKINFRNLSKNELNYHYSLEEKFVAR